jgi:hypothetical protein
MTWTNEATISGEYLPTQPVLSRETFESFGQVVESVHETAILALA